jgi:alpha-L-fucosidase
MPDTAPWQTLMSVDGRGWWSYNPDPCMGFETMMAWVLTSAVNDGNILINFTPGPTGEFPEDQVALMGRFGQWMRTYGDSVRGTRGGPYRPVYAFEGLGQDRPDAAPVMLKAHRGQASYVPRIGSTRKGNRVYLHVLSDPPGGRMTLPTPGLRLRAARLLNDDRPVGLAWQAERAVLDLPPRGREFDMVVMLDFDGSVMDAEPIEMALTMEAGR